MFLVNCHGDLLRKIALTAQRSGIPRGEYSIIFFLSDPLSSFIGNYHWERGDDLDIVRVNPFHAEHALSSASCLEKYYSKTCVKRPLKNRQNKDLIDKY